MVDVILPSEKRCHAFPSKLAESAYGIGGPNSNKCQPVSSVAKRHNLSQVRLDIQRALMDAGTGRHTPIQVTTDGVIWDGHHVVRIAAEVGIAVTVKVVNVKVNPTAASILDLPIG